MLTARTTPAWPRKKSVYCHNFNLLRSNDWCHSPSPPPSCSPSPYPPSTPSLSSCSSDDDGSDSESQSTPTAANTTIKSPSMRTRLRTTLASLPECQLRELIAKLVDHSPGFQHALARELLHSQLPTPALSPDTPRPAETRSMPAPQKHPQQPPRKRRRLRRATITGGTATDMGHRTAAYRPRSSSYSPRHRVSYYHPGRLEEDVFEFPSWSSTGGGDEEEEQEKDLPVLRTIRMWSCCNGDVGSAGCCCNAPPVRMGHGHGKVSRTGAT